MAEHTDFTITQYSAACFTSMEEALISLFGEGVKIVQTRRVAGGDINEAYELRLTDGTSLFMKSNSSRAGGGGTDGSHRYAAHSLQRDGRGQRRVFFSAFGIY